MRVFKNQIKTGCAMSKEGPRSVDPIALKELQAFDAWLHECSRKVRKSINELADAREDLMFAFHKASLEKGRAALSTFVRAMEDSHAKFCEGNPYQAGDLKTRHVPLKAQETKEFESPGVLRIGLYAPGEKKPIRLIGPQFSATVLDLNRLAKVLKLLLNEPLADLELKIFSDDLRMICD